MLIRRIAFLSSMILGFGVASVSQASAQSQSTDLGGFRGNRAQVTITIKEGSSQLIGPLVTVKLYYQGALAGQMATTKGRVVFLLNGLGDYTVTADAVGYQSAQKEIYIPIAVETMEDIVLRSNSTANELGPSARPLLAPKAREGVEKALQALSENKLDAAEKAIERAAALAPSHPDVLYVQGVILLKRRRWDQAEDVLEKAAQIDPKNAQALSALGMAYFDGGKPDQAIPVLQRSLEISAESWETHYTLGKAYYANGQYPEALKESQDALEKSRGRAPQVELLVAQALTAAGRFEDSAQALRDFLKEHPKDPEAGTARKWLDKLSADGKIRRP
jgi:tetratricopeptide (TPR) repeat protein